jgi:hypothetical protein
VHSSTPEHVWTDSRTGYQPRAAGFRPHLTTHTCSAATYKLSQQDSGTPQTSQQNKGRTAAPQAAICHTYIRNNHICTNNTHQTVYCFVKSCLQALLSKFRPTCSWARTAKSTSILPVHHSYYRGTKREDTQHVQVQEPMTNRPRHPTRFLACMTRQLCSHSNAYKQTQAPGLLSNTGTNHHKNKLTALPTVDATGQQAQRARSKVV